MTRKYGEGEEKKKKKKKISPSANENQQQQQPTRQQRFAKIWQSKRRSSGSAKALAKAAMAAANAESEASGGSVSSQSWQYQAPIWRQSNESWRSVGNRSETCSAETSWKLAKKRLWRKRNGKRPGYENRSGGWRHQ